MTTASTLWIRGCGHRISCEVRSSSSSCHTPALLALRPVNQRMDAAPSCQTVWLHARCAAPSSVGA
jgi:hypothetical protein